MESISLLTGLGELFFSACCVTGFTHPEFRNAGHSNNMSTWILEASRDGHDTTMFREGKL